MVSLTIQSSAVAQVAPPASQPVGAPVIAPGLKGRLVEGVRIVGNSQVPTSTILNVVRTREGERFDPATVEEDYQRIYNLKKFSQVQARVEPTKTGVIVIFQVNEQRTVSSIAYRGNYKISTNDIQNVVDIRKGETIDRFKIALARQEVERLYRNKDFPLAHVEVDNDLLNQRGELVFNIVEGPEVRVRKVAFKGAKSFPQAKLRDQVKTKYWIWIFRPGTLDFDQVDDDVAAVRRFYENHGFFDVRVGRKIIWSPDTTEVQVNFEIEEGPRYTVDRVTFKGNSAVPEAKLHEGLKLNPGSFWDHDLIERDIKELVKDYSPYGFIYQGPTADPKSYNQDYLHIEPRPVFRKETAKVDLVYEISEGKPFNLGRILVKGNYKTQDKLVLREMRMAPGQLYNSAEVQRAVDRLRGTPFYTNVTVTPVGDDPKTRDLLVEVTETKTASFNIGAGVNSNGGIGGNITYEQRNFDITNWPQSWADFFSDRSFTGAGQRFRVSLEPGTQNSNASILFSEPYIFDQPYSFTEEAYLRDRQRFHYDESRIGDRVSFGKRFDYENSAQLTLRGEDIDIHGIDEPLLRAPEIVDLKGHSQLSSTALQYRNDTTPRGFLPYEGHTFTIGDEQAGTMGGNFQFNRVSTSFDQYFTVFEDLLDRKTILSFHGDTGYIFAGAPFFERYYGGGIGSIRGFRFRGVSPRKGLDDDAVGGDFLLVGSAELSFPIAADMLRGVVFTDVGDVEEDLKIGQFRSSIGAGVRLILPFLGQTPIAVDFAYPLSKSSQDETQFISFSLGFVQ